MTIKTLTQLVERVEAAGEGQQAACIWNAGAAIFGEDFAGELAQQFVWFAQKEAWTDAALLLVPEGWTRGLLTWPGYDNGKLIANAKAVLHHAISSGGGPKETGYAATPALALTAAALRAHIAEQEKG